MGSDGNQRSIEGVDLGCGLKRVGKGRGTPMGRNVMLKQNRYIVAGIF